MSIRDNLKSKYKGFGDYPPGWTGGDLGRADRDPDGLLQGLGLSRFRGRGEDGLQDIYSILELAIRSSVLGGLYTGVRKNESRGQIIIEAAADLYRFGSGQAVMIRFIRATLAAADKLGWIALPSGLKTDVTSSGTGVVISWDGFAKK
jgi:hypothetical protein